MNYVKAAVVGLATFISGFALFRLIILLLHIAAPYLEKTAGNQTAGSAHGWAISFGPHSGLILLLLISVVVAYRQYCRLRDRTHNAR